MKFKETFFIKKIEKYTFWLTLNQNPSCKQDNSVEQHLSFDKKKNLEHKANACIKPIHSSDKL